MPEAEVLEKEKLVEEAKLLGIKSPHLMHLETLRTRIAKAKDDGSTEDDASAGSSGDAGDGELSPIQESLKNMANSPPTPPDSGNALASHGSSESGDNKDNNSSESTNEGSTVKSGSGWLYHEKEQPRVFVEGEEVPVGWNTDNRKFWKVLDSGKFINVNG